MRVWLGWTAGFALCGLVQGALQWFALRRRSHAIWWLAVSPASWALLGALQTTPFFSTAAWVTAPFVWAALQVVTVRAIADGESQRST